MYLGLDVGTHAARAAYLDARGEPRPVRFPDGSEEMPALARQTMHGLVVGTGAAGALSGNAETTVCGCTRLMGHAGSIPPELIARLPYEVREVGGEAVCNLLYAEVRAGEIYGRIVRAVVEAAAAALEERVEGVVLAVPASAEDRFRIQARAAVEAQGIGVRRVINRPAAALMAARLPDSARRVAVVNCGDGSTDVSIAERGPGDTCSLRILATAGDMLLGGDDLAWKVAENLNERFRVKAGVDVFAVGESRLAALGLRSAAGDALKSLCAAPQATLVLDHGGGFGRDLVAVVGRQEVDAWLAPFLERIGSLCGRAMAEAGVGSREVDAVLLTGSWAALPPVLEAVADAFGRPVREMHVEDAAILPSLGAALAAGDAREAYTLWDVTPYALGINCHYDGVELFSPIIFANTPIPTPPTDTEGAHTERYRTLHPDQESVTLDVLQYRGPKRPDPYGTDPVRPHDCEVLGSWTFDGLHPKKGQRAPFTVTFAIDADGVLHLYARETETGHSLAASVERGIG